MDRCVEIILSKVCLIECVDSGFELAVDTLPVCISISGSCIYLHHGWSYVPGFIYKESHHQLRMATDAI
jgi:hypothetical protein